jgi:hypothetical protein
MSETLTLGDSVDRGWADSYVLAMSSIGFRDSSVVIIETSRTVIRAGLGLHELLRAPSIVSISHNLCTTWFTLDCLLLCCRKSQLV